MLAVEDHVFVHLVGDGDGVVLVAQLSDQLQFRSIEDPTRRVVRRVDDDGPRSFRECGAQRLGVDAEVRRLQRDVPQRGARHRGIGPVRVVHRLDEHDLVSLGHETEKARGECFRAPRRHGDLVTGVHGDPGSRREPVGDPLHERQDPEAPRILVVAVTHRSGRGVLDEVRTIEVGEPLSQIDRIVFDRQTGDRGEHRLTELLQTWRDLHRGSVPGDRPDLSGNSRRPRNVLTARVNVSRRSTDQNVDGTQTPDDQGGM